MAKRIWAVYIVELAKAFRTRSVLAGPVVVVLAVLAVLPAHRQAEGGATAYEFIAFATPLALNTAGFVMVLIYCAGLIASELGQGTLRQVLTRPVLRHEFYLGKLLMGLSHALLLEMLVAATAWASARTVGPLHGVTYGGELLHTQWAMLHAYAMGALVAAAPLCAGVAFALMLSTLLSNSGAAIATAIAAWVLADTLKLTFGIEEFVFSTYLDIPWEVFARRCEAIDAAWFPGVTHCLLVSGITFVVCSAVGIAAIRRRDLG